MARPKLTEYIPHTPTVKQAAFLLLPNREALFGGAAGGGKSDALLMGALQYVDVPGYAALLLRRTYADLSLPGALMDRSREWLAGTDAKWKAETHSWEFPSGAAVAFGYLDNDSAVYRYQSSEFQFIGFDELSQFTEFQYRYLFSRLRRKAGVSVPIRMRGATNPGGVGHAWVKDRFIANRTPGRVFIPARLTDNPHVDQVAYTEALGELDAVTRQQLLHGDWEVQRDGPLAKREWFPIVDAAPAQARKVRFWDFAATAAEVKGADPDYTVGALVSEAGGLFYVEHVIRGRFGPGAVEAVVMQTAQADGKQTPIHFEQEPGSGGKLFTSAMIRALVGWQVRAMPARGDKVTRAMPFLSQAEAGNVRLVRGAWVSDWLDEMVAFPAGAHDDQVDATAGAFAVLATGKRSMRAL